MTIWKAKFLKAKPNIVLASMLASFLPILSESFQHSTNKYRDQVSLLNPMSSIPAGTQHVCRDPMYIIHSHPNIKGSYISRNLASVPRFPVALWTAQKTCGSLCFDEAWEGQLY